MLRFNYNGLSLPLRVAAISFLQRDKGCKQKNNIRSSDDAKQCQNLFTQNKYQDLFGFIAEWEWLVMDGRQVEALC